MNRINFSADGFEVHPIIIRKERKDQLNDNLIMFFTGFSRLSSEIAKEQVKATKDKTIELKEMLRLVDEAERILTDRHGDLDEFGRLLDYTWKLKRGLTNKVSTDALDAIYKIAMNNGALGGQLLGAGGGGFFLFYVPKEQQSRVKAALQDFLYIPFRFEDSGSSVLYYQPENYVMEEA